MSDDLRSAAKRLVEGEFSENYPAFMATTFGLADGFLLARAYLAEHPEDDEELVTPGWAEAIGFIKTHPFAWRHRLNERICLHHDANITQFAVEGAFYVRNPVRGDVRRLCKALGIELKEKS